MNHATPALSRLAHAALRWLRHAASAVIAVTVLAQAPAQAQSAKIARDLQAVLSASTTPKINWARDVNGTRYVKVLIIGTTDDAELSGLRSAVMSAGGSIYYRYSSVLGLAALLPASKVATIAARSDVHSISPNRMMARSTSHLESVTGAAAVRQPRTSRCRRA